MGSAVASLDLHKGKASASTVLALLPRAIRWRLVDVTPNMAGLLHMRCSRSLEMKHPHHWAALLSSFLLMEAHYGGKVHQKKKKKGGKIKRKNPPPKKRQSQLVIRAFCDLVHKITRSAAESWCAANLRQVIWDFSLHVRAIILPSDTLVLNERC